MVSGSVRRRQDASLVGEQRYQFFSSGHRCPQNEKLAFAGSERGKRHRTSTGGWTQPSVLKRNDGRIRYAKSRQRSEIRHHGERGKPTEGSPQGTQVWRIPARKYLRISQIRNHRRRNHLSPLNARNASRKRGYDRHDAENRIRIHRRTTRRMSL